MTSAQIKTRSRALTLVELVIVIVLVTLFLALLAPSLQAARSQSKTEVCLTHLKSLGNAIRLYAEAYDTLPGPAHPAIYHDQTMEGYGDSGGSSAWIEYMLSRQIAHLLGNVIDRSECERIISCPTMAGIQTESLIQEIVGSSNPAVLPANYCVNNWSSSDSSLISDTRGTIPDFYFGGTAASVIDSVSPRRFAQIPNASREWMIADAWYRPRANTPLTFLQQEGPYQAAWSGIAMPNFAPHLRRAGTSYSYTTSDDRAAQSSIIRQQKSDGVTNTLFFDGHAAPVASRTAIINGFYILYGFPGTVNPKLTSEAEQALWDRMSWH